MMQMTEKMGKYCTGNKRSCIETLFSTIYTPNDVQMVFNKPWLFIYKMLFLDSNHIVLPGASRSFPYLAISAKVSTSEQLLLSLLIFADSSTTPDLKRAD